MLRKHNLDGSYFTSTSIAITTFKNYGDLLVLSIWLLQFESYN